MYNMVEVWLSMEIDICHCKFPKHNFLHGTVTEWFGWRTNVRTLVALRMLVTSFISSIYHPHFPFAVKSFQTLRFHLHNRQRFLHGKLIDSRSACSIRKSFINYHCTMYCRWVNFIMIQTNYEQIWTNHNFAKKMPIEIGFVWNVYFFLCVRIANGKKCWR